MCSKFWGHAVTKLPGSRSPASKSGYPKGKQREMEKKGVSGGFLVEKVTVGRLPNPCTQAQSRSTKNEQSVSLQAKTLDNILFTWGSRCSDAASADGQMSVVTALP